jgi:hypothetical protein
MWRSLFAVVLVYGGGHPSLDGYRPALLDRPLQGFHRDVNEAAREGRKVLVALDDARWLRYLKVYIARMDAQLRGSG